MYRLPVPAAQHLPASVLSGVSRRAFFLKVTAAAVVACSLLLTQTPVSSAAPETGPNRSVHSIHHVFVLTLENKNFSDTFGPAFQAPYLSQTLVKQGALLTQYYGTGHASLDNYIAMVSGQSSTPETSADCGTYQDFQQTGMAPHGQVVGKGCVYPSSVKTVANQLSAAGLTWKGYMGDMGNDPARESATCGHPVLNTTDRIETSEAPSERVPQGDMYATRHNPFVYFHSIIDSRLCQKNVVNLNLLAADLKTIATTPNFAFIAPNVCDDGHDAPCVDGSPGGLASINVFLQKWVPRILASPAYKRDGLLIINFDEGSTATIERRKDGIIASFEGASCCNEDPDPTWGLFPRSARVNPEMCSSR